MRDLTVCISVLSVACTTADQSETAKSETASSTASESGPAVQNAPPVSGPRLMTDSAAQEPFFKVEAGELVLHVPASMSVVINDSLPGFTPVQREAYDSSLIELANNRDGEIREFGETENDSLGRYALSAAIGDFDGDSASDIALLGTSRDSTATLFVLARSASRQKPQVIFIARPRPADHLNREWRYLNTVHAGAVPVFDEDGKSLPFQLKTDGVQVGYFGKGAEVFFLKHGVVQSIITSD